MTLAASGLAQSDFILVIVPVASLAVTAISVWVAIYFGIPRQRLLYWIPAAVPLVNAPRGPGHVFRLLYNGDEVAQPYLLSIRLLSRGREDIREERFERGDPIRLDLSVPVAGILQVAPVGRRAFAPKAASENNILKIGPSHIGRRQTIIITLLLDGCPAHPAQLNADALANVKVREVRRLPGLFNRNFLVGVAATMIFALAAFIALAALAANRVYMPQTIFESNIKALTEIVNGMLSHTVEQVYIFLAWIAGLLAVLAGAMALGTRPG